MFSRKRSMKASTIGGVRQERGAYQSSRGKIKLSIIYRLFSCFFFCQRSVHELSTCDDYKDTVRGGRASVFVRKIDRLGLIERDRMRNKTYRKKKRKTNFKNQNERLLFQRLFHSSISFSITTFTTSAASTTPYIPYTDD